MPHLSSHEVWSLLLCVGLPVVLCVVLVIIAERHEHPHDGQPPQSGTLPPLNS